MSERLIIFDTTLRDGEQSPGATMTEDEKIEVARQLVKLGVDVIEAGFPAASPGDLRAVQRISREVKGVTICALARANRQDIDAAWEGVRDAEQPRIHTFIATSPIHMEYKLRKTPEQVLEAARFAVRTAKRYVSDVEFSAEDATRSIGTSSAVSSLPPSRRAPRRSTSRIPSAMRYPMSSPSWSATSWSTRPASKR